MSTSRRVGLGILVAAAAVGVALAVASSRPPSGDSPAPEGTPPPPPERSSDSGRPPKLAGSGDGRRGPASTWRGRVEGVAKLGGNPVPARIRATREVPNPQVAGGTITEELATAAAGEDGRFAIAIPTHVLVCLVGETPTARGARQVYAWEQDPVPRGDLVLVEGRESLPGIAVDGQGRPWRGTVRLAYSGSRLPFGVLRTAAPDADGRFRFDGIPPGDVLVGTDIAPGARVFGPTVGVPTATPYRLVAAFTGRPVEVRTVDFDTGRAVPVARVTVEAWRASASPGAPEPDPIAHQTAVTDDAGIVTCFVPEGADSVSVGAARDGYVGETTDLPPGAGACSLRLTRTGTVIGTVVRDDGGSPVAGIEVRLSGWGPERSTVTDGSGGFRFEEVCPTEHGRSGTTTSARAAGLGLATSPSKDGANSVTVTVRSGETTVVSIRVGPTRSIVGSVRRADGAPATDAEVWLSAPRVGCDSAAFYAARARTDAAGAFRLDGIPLAPSPSDIVVLARAPGTGTAHCPLEVSAAPALGAEAPPTRSAPRQAGDPVVLVLPPSGNLDLTVIDKAGGEPVAGLSIHLSYEGVIEFTGVTNASGRVHASGLTPGRLVVCTKDQSWLDHEYVDPQIVDVPAASTGTATVAFTRSCRIGGTIVYADGSPVRSERFGLSLREVGGHNGCSTDVRGQFGQRLPWARYDVLVVRGTMDTALDVVEDDPRVLASARLDPEVTDAVLRLGILPVPPLSLLVMDEAGRPIRSGSIWVEACDAKESAAFYDSGWSDVRIHDGRATLSGFRVPVWIGITPDPDPDAARAPVRVGPIAAGTRSLEVKVAPGFEITGRVVGPDGRGVGGATLYLSNTAPFDPTLWRSPPYEAATSSAEGAFRFEGLPAGSYTLAARPEPPLSFPPAIAVVAGQADVEIPLVPVVDTDLRVLEPDGSPAPGVAVAAYLAPWYSDTFSSRGVTDAVGVVRLRGLHPNQTYLLEAQGGNTGAPADPWRLEGWTPAPTTISLVASDLPRIRVVDEAGTPLFGATVTLRYADHPEAPAESLPGTEEIGSFVGVRRQPGPITLVAQVGWAFSRTKRVEPGTREVVLEVPKARGRILLEMVDWPKTPPRHPGGFSAECFLWDEDEVGVRMHVVPTPEGAILVEGVSPDRVWAAFIVNRVHPDWVALVTGIRADGAIRRVTRQPIVRLEGRVTSPDGVRPARVTVVETGTDASLDDDGWFVVPGLPSGRWTVGAAGHHARRIVYAQERVEDGRLPDLVLRSR